jgi:ABC-type antimicrobial peptide transport system permease subunit
MLVPIVAAIHAIDAEQPVYDVRTMEDVVDRSLVQRRVTTALITSFGIIALVLAAVGVYGVVAFGVAQRVREFGVRMALGATSGELTRLVVSDGLSMAAFGLAIGLAMSFALSQLMAGLVYGISARDGASMLGGGFSLVVAVMLASYVPARRAAAVDPAVTLRSE